MLIRIEPSSGIPITRQIMDQIRAHCASSTLRTGDRLPSVRELARQLTVNHNTIQRAYERLTAEGVLQLRHGDGTYVAQFPLARHVRRQRTLLQEEADRFVRRALSLGLNPPEIRATLDDALTKLEPKNTTTGGRPHA